jgi:hypothetical protein
LYQEDIRPLFPPFTPDVFQFVSMSRRSQLASRYYYIDFGNVVRTSNGSSDPVLAYKTLAQPLPEHEEENYDRFKADVFQLGALMRRHFIIVSSSPSSVYHLNRLKDII